MFTSTRQFVRAPTCLISCQEHLSGGSSTPVLGERVSAAHAARAPKSAWFKTWWVFSSLCVQDRHWASRLLPMGPEADKHTSFAWCFLEEGGQHPGRCVFMHDVRFGCVPRHWHGDCQNWGFKNRMRGASLVVQWLRFHAPMLPQGSRICPQLGN